MIYHTFNFAGSGPIIRDRTFFYGLWNGERVPGGAFHLANVPTGAMRHLEAFLDSAAAAGGRFRQDFPPDCVPIRAGKIVLPIQSYVSTIEEESAAP